MRKRPGLAGIIMLLIVYAEASSALSVMVKGEPEESTGHWKFTWEADTINRGAEVEARKSH
jgi:hypothetical protein